MGFLVGAIVLFSLILLAILFVIAAIAALIMLAIQFWYITLPIIGIIINSVTKNGYNLIELKNNLEELTSLPVLGSVQHVDNFQLEKFIEIFSQNIKLEKFL